MLSDPHLLGCDAYQANEARTGPANCTEQKESEPCQWITAAGEKPEISPRIEIVFNRQQGNVFFSTPLPKLSAIGVLPPFNIAEHFPIGGTKRNEVTAATMVRTEDKFVGRQLRESSLDVARAQLRAIPPDGHNFVVAQLSDPLDGIFKTRREIAAHLSVMASSGIDGLSGRREKV